MLIDVRSLGAGSTIFIRNEGKKAVFRSIEDSDHVVRYLWSKNKDDFDHCKFRIIENTKDIFDTKKTFCDRSLFFITIAIAALVALVYMGFSR